MTKPDRSLLDLAEVVDRRALERALDESHRLRLCTDSQLRAVVKRNPGRVGGARLTAALDEHELGSTATENDLEELFLSICDQCGIPRPQCQQPLMGYRVDFLWREQQVVAETDGRAWHTTGRAFEADRVRDAELDDAGWTVRRFTWLQLTNRREWVAERVATALTRSRTRPPRSSPRPR